MLVGVLISIMISIVVGVSLVPTIVSSINTAKTTPNAPAGLSGLLDVLAYVFVSSVATLRSNSHRITCQIRGKLNAQAHANPELNGRQLPKCVETRGQASHVDGGIVRHSMKVERTESAVILLGAVAWIKIGPLMQKCLSVIPLSRGSLNLKKHGNPELATSFRKWASVETLYGIPFTG